MKIRIFVAQIRIVRFYRIIADDRVELVLEWKGNFVSVDELLDKKRGSVDLTQVFNKITEIKENLERGRFSYMERKNISYASAVGIPGKIICVGLNYRSHIEETGKVVPKHPVLFSKYSNSLAGHLASIKIPYPDLKVDYEGELGVIIGERAENVGKEYEKYVFGYFIGNDVSSRELQLRTSQYLLGKTLDGFYPNGPSVVTKEEISNPQNLKIRTTVNGEIRQNSNTSNMIFSVGELIAYVSKYLTLEPGDVISTGTPEGVVLGMKDNEMKWLQPGDVVEVEIEGLGALKNTFI